MRQVSRHVEYAEAPSPILEVAHVVLVAAIHDECAGVPSLLSAKFMKPSLPETVNREALVANHAIPGGAKSRARRPCARVMSETEGRLT